MSDVVRAPSRPAKAAVEPARVEAGDMRHQSACDHRLGESRSVPLPERKQRLHPRRRELLFAIGANVF
jgi:hypothetical protein